MALYPKRKYFAWLDAGYTTYASSPPPQRPWLAASLDLIPGRVVVRTNPRPENWGGTSSDRCPNAGCWFGDRAACGIFVQAVIELISQRLRDGLSLCTEQSAYARAGDSIGILHHVDYDPEPYVAIFLD